MNTLETIKKAPSTPLFTVQADTAREALQSFRNCVPAARTAALVARNNQNGTFSIYA